MSCHGYAGTGGAINSGIWIAIHVSGPGDFHRWVASRMPPKPISSRLAVRLMDGRLDDDALADRGCSGKTGRDHQMKMLVGLVVGLPADCRCCCSKKESEPQSPQATCPGPDPDTVKQPKRNTLDGQDCNRKVEGSEGQEGGILAVASAIGWSDMSRSPPSSRQVERKLAAERTGQVGAPVRLLASATISESRCLLCISCSKSRVPLKMPGVLRGERRAAQADGREAARGTNRRDRTAVTQPAPE
jgi:hypothetical protein